MNYLGHLYFSGDRKDLMQANLYGDFYKGRIHESLPILLQEGIRLHRQIDDYIDRHPAVMELVSLLSADLPKVSGIAVDIYFDHLLAANWKGFHTMDYSTYLENFYSSLEDSPVFPESFRTFCRALVTHRWMHHYQEEIAVDKMCNGVNSKLSFDSALVHGFTAFQSHKVIISEVFDVYMRDAIEHFGIVKPAEIR